MAGTEYDPDECIYEAAIREFGRAGFAGTDPEEIARRAGVAPEEIARRFRDRTELLLKTFLYSRRYWECEFDSGIQAAEILYLLMDKQIDLAENQPEVFLFYSLACRDVSIPGELEELREKLFRHSQAGRVMQAAREAGCMPDRDVYELYQVFESNLGSLLSNYLKYKLPLPPREFLVSSVWYTRRAIDKVELEKDRNAVLHSAEEDEQFLSTLKNIDDSLQVRKELEKAKAAAEAANKAKSIFLFNMSHDIRTPMNAIMGYANLLEKYGDDPRKRKLYTRNIKVSGEYLLELINNILELSRIESGKVSLDLEMVDLREFQRGVEIIFQDEYKKKELTVERDYQIRNPYVLCDEVKLRQILLNVISNAVKYTPQGGRLWMSLKELPGDRENEEVVEFILKDNGIGMSRDFLPKLFDSFSRERSVTENKIIGSGLGMGIVKNLVELMKGTIRVESELGMGTTVTIRIPTITSPTMGPQVKDGISWQECDLTGLRVLLAEDNEMNREIATELLEERGMQVTAAEDGIEAVGAVERVPAGTYDLVLMDIQMPQMNGYQAAEAIRAIPDRRAQVPIVAMTANVFEEDRQRAREAGMNGFVAKPVDMVLLAQEISRVLQESVSPVNYLI